MILRCPGTWRWHAGHWIVLPHICGNRRIHAYISCTASGSGDFSSVHWPQCPAYELRLAGTKNITRCTGRRHGLLSFKAVQDALRHWDQLLWAEDIWSQNTYRIRHQNCIEHMVNLVNLVHSSLKILPYFDEYFTKYKNASPQERRSHISW